jgi:actin-related protein 4
VPKSVIPSHYGFLEGPTKGLDQRYYFGDTLIYSPVQGLEIRNPMSKEGVVEDWDAATKLWEYTITSRLTNSKPSNPKTNGLNDTANGDEDADMDDVEEAEKPLEDNPLLMTEPSWSSAKAREKCLQIAMEDFGCPAFWLSRTAVNTA